MITTSTASETSLNVPFAADESIIKYHTKLDGCDCDDYRFKKGSYRLHGRKVCKHMFRQYSPYKLVGTAYRVADHAYRAKTAKLAAKSKPSSALVALATQDRHLDPASCGAEFLELTDDPFAAFS